MSPDRQDNERIWMTQNSTVPSTLTLRDGVGIPVLGFGTYELEGIDAYNATLWALEAGYRHIDSAAWYENEKEVGAAIKKFLSQHSEVSRSDIFYTTKLRDNIGYSQTQLAIKRSLDECGLDYIDLYLIHGPHGGPKKRLECYKACLDAKNEGKCRSVGVSNFGVRHIEELIDAGAEIPSVNQIDLHPFMTRNALVDFCKSHGIALEAWGPLVRGYRFDHPAIVKLSEKYKRSAAQVLLRYSVQKGYITLPKSASKERIVNNSLIFDFELAEDDIQLLDGLDEHLVTDWDPSECP